MNMSYCRFHNTLIDLRDCIEHIEDTDLSQEEHAKRVQLIEECCYVAEELGYLRKINEKDFGIVNNPD